MEPVTLRRPLAGEPPAYTSRRARATTPDVTPRPQVLNRPRLEFFLPWLFWLAMTFGSFEALFGLAAEDRGFLAAGVLTGAFALVVLGARRLVAMGRGMEATWLVALALCVAGFLGTLTVPEVDQAMALMPVLAAALLLPYATGRFRRPIVLLALGSVSLVLVGVDIGTPVASAGPLDDIFAQVILVAIAGLLIAVLVDFWDNAVRSIGALESSISRQRALGDERAILGRLFDGLEPKMTIEATAGAIAAALVGLPGVDVGLVLECHDGGLRVVGVAGPANFGLHAGDRLAGDRAASLLAAANDGPFAQSARSPAGPLYAGGVGAEIGVQASIYAPMRSGADTIGLLAIGTCDPLLISHFVEDLPVVGAVAATATALLAPGLLARRETADARGQIERIIADRSFMPVFQAITTLPEREVVAYEALTRFTDGERPDVHFAAADAAGLGVELELVTLDAAVRAAERIPYDAWLTLNVSPAAIQTGVQLSRILRRSHHPLILELTEHVAVSDYAVLRAALKALKVPFQVAIDDAGAGYASMTHVVELGPSLVKLDISLVRGIDTDPVRQALVAGMLYFSERADCRLLAEGIETEEEFATLASIGIPLGQGYLLGRPGEFIGRPEARPATDPVVAAA